LEHIPEDSFWEAIEAIYEINYETLNEIMAGFDNVPSWTWDILKAYTNSLYIETKSSLDDKTTDKKKVQYFTWNEVRPNSKKYRKMQSLDASDIIINKKIKEKIKEKIRTEKNTREDKIEFERKYNAVLAVLKDLTYKEKQVFMLRIDKERNKKRTFKEIGEMLEIDKSTVREHYNVAIKKIKKSLNTPK